MIRTTHLFPLLNQKLIELLRSLEPQDWIKKTIAPKWTVKDIASHLLDGNLRSLSMLRDHHWPPGNPESGSYNHLVDYLNQLNAEWVKATERLSPQVLIALLEQSGKELAGFLATLDPFADAALAVNWAGEQVSKNWFHIAREYTEKWHHQQQIRDATGKPGIMTRELFYPVMDTFMCALPYAYRGVEAGTGSAVCISIEPAIGGSWWLVKKTSNWQLEKEAPAHIDASLFMDADTAWKLFTKGIKPEEALQNSIIQGNKELVLPALSLIAVMA
jgi:uncharacterized protein (TIGR03083 family)